MAYKEIVFNIVYFFHCIFLGCFLGLLGIFFMRENSSAVEVEMMIERLAKEPGGRHK